MIDIVPATIRDLTYIAANMRVEDREEVYCQLTPEATSLDVAALSFQAQHKYVAVLRGRNVAAFGATQASVCGSVYSAWAWGTKDMKRAVPRIGRYFMSVIAPQLVVGGVRRVEVRSIEGHDLAHRWLSGLGARCETRLQDYARNGETFLLYSFCLTDLRNSYVLKREAPEASPETQSIEPGIVSGEGRRGNSAQAGQATG